MNNSGQGIKMTFLEKVTFYIQLQIDKHGSYGKHDNVEDAINAMSTYQLLELISTAMDTPDEDYESMSAPKSKTAPG